MTDVTLSKLEKMIYVVRDQKVMIDFDLAELYGVETKTLKRAVRRNMDRFPDDFMFELTQKELENWSCHAFKCIKFRAGHKCQYLQWKV